MGVAHDGSDLWVAVATSGTLATSPDGINWTQQTSSFSTTTIRKAAHDGSDLWVAVGYDGKLATGEEVIVIDTFPTMHNVLKLGDNIQTFTATTEVKPGQVVAIHATGVSGAVDPSVAAAGSRSVGVAIYGAAAGSELAVAMRGCIVDVANTSGSDAIDAGDYLETNDNAVGGTVSTAAVTAVGGAVGTNHLDVIGIAIDDIAAAGIGKMRIQPMAFAQLNDA